MKFVVDQETCICCSVCTTLAPSVFDINESQSCAEAVNKDFSDSETIAEAQEALENCPMGAISEK